MPEQILSDSRIEEIRKRLNQFMAENTLRSNSTIGNNIGMSPGTISLFRNGKYEVRKEKLSELANRINDYLDSEEAEITKAVSKGILTFAETTAAQTIFKVINHSAEEHTIGVIAGVPGCGKTITVNEYKKRNKNTILIEVTPLVTVRSLINDVCKELKIPLFSYTLKDTPRLISNQNLFEEIIKKLNGTNRILIIDEGENLSVSCIEIIRRIQDFTSIGMLLSGTPKLLDRLRGPRKELQQLFSRIGIKEEITLLQQGDVKAILHVNFPEAMKFANTFLQLSKHNGRLLQHLITLVKRTINETGEELSDDLIDLAAGSLLT